MQSLPSLFDHIDILHSSYFPFLFPVYQPQHLYLLLITFLYQSTSLATHQHYNHYRLRICLALHFSNTAHVSKWYKLLFYQSTATYMSPVPSILNKETSSPVNPHQPLSSPYSDLDSHFLALYIHSALNRSFSPIFTVNLCYILSLSSPLLLFKPSIELLWPHLHIATISRYMHNTFVLYFLT